MDKGLVLFNNLKEIRKSKNISQEQLAEMVGTTRQTIIAIEKGIFNPSAKLALLLCVALDCKFEDLFIISRYRSCYPNIIQNPLHIKLYPLA